MEAHLAVNLEAKLEAIFDATLEEKHEVVDTKRGVNQYQVQFKMFFNLYLNHSIISNEQRTLV